MSEKTAESLHKTKAIADVLRELNEREVDKGNQMLVLGHGTFRSPDDVLAYGLGMKQPDLGTTTIPIAKDERGVTQIQSWEHHGRVPWVIILAAEAPAPDSELSGRERTYWEEGLIQPSTIELADWGLKFMIPPEWVLGAVDTTTGETVLNPQFTGRQVTAEDMATSEGLKYIAGKLGGPTIRSSKTRSVPMPQVPRAGNDAPEVW